MVKIFDTCQNISKQMLKNFYSCQNNSAYAWIFYVMTRIGHDWNMAMTNMQIKVTFLSRKHISYCCQNLKNHQLYKILKKHQFLSNFEKSSIFFQILKIIILANFWKLINFCQILKKSSFFANFWKIIIFAEFWEISPKTVKMFYQNLKIYEILKHHNFCQINFWKNHKFLLNFEKLSK